MSSSLIEQVASSLPQPIRWILHQMGQMALLLWEAIQFIVKGKIHWRKTLQEIASIGFDSLPMTLLICGISGSVLALQTAQKFALTGADAYVGGLVALAIVREIAPIFACLTVGARSGTAIAAEIANMKVTEQVDALKIMHVSPVRYLVVPRLLAAILCLPLLTFLGEVIGIVSGMFVAQAVSGLHRIKYMESVWLYLSRHDLNVSLIKAAVFGVLLAIISCTIGLNTKGGAKAVGESTTRSVVWIGISIIIADFFLSWIFFGTGYNPER